MKPGNPWSVKGIQPAAREAAKEAARRHGMTLGQWLNHVIMDGNEGSSHATTQHQPDTTTQAPYRRASRPSQPPRHTVAEGQKTQQLQDKIADLSARLDSITNAHPEQVDLDQWRVKESSPTGWNDIAVRTAPPEKQAKSYMSRNPGTGNRFGPSREHNSSFADKLDSLTSASPAPNHNLEAIEATLEKITSHIEISDRQNSDVMKGIQARLSELSSRSTVSNNETVKELSDTVGVLEEQLSQLSHRVIKTEAEASEYLNYDDKINTLANRLEKAPGSEAQQQILDLEGRIDKISSSFEEFLQNPVDENPAAHIEVQLNELSDRLASGEQQFGKLASVEESINQLFEAVEQNRNLTNENNANASQKALQSIEAMETIAEQAAQRAAENAAQRSAEHVAAIMADDGLNKKEVMSSLADLRDEMHQLQQTTIDEARNDIDQAISDKITGLEANSLNQPMNTLQQEFDQLQDSSRSADLRTQDTLEAVHETLEKVVERITNLEATASPQSYAGKERAVKYEPVIPAPPSVDPNPNAEDTFNWQKGADTDRTPLENDGENIAPESDSSEAPAPSLNHNFLEAARRAAQAAAQTPINLDVENINKAEISPVPPKGNLLAMATESEKRRRTFLFAAAAILLVVGALSAASLMTNNSSNVAVTTKSTVSKTNSSGPNPKASSPPTTTPAKTSKPAKPPISQITPESAVKKAGIENRQSAIQPAIAPGENNTKAVHMSKNAPLTTNSVSPTQKAGEITKPNTSDTKSTVSSPVNMRSSGADAKPDLSLSPTSKKASSTKLLHALPPEEIGPMALREAAASGDPSAQFEIAVRYTDGKLVTQHFGKAISWYQKAAAQGLAPAQYRLGTFYEKGRGVAQDKIAARNWYERAAAKGNLKAIHNLAVMYANSSQGKPDFAKAGLWFRKAAELGLADSQYNLAILHDRGLGVSKDQTTAYFWFRIAASQGDRDAAARAATIEKRMTPDEIAKTNNRVSNWNPLTLNKNANEVSSPFDGWQSTGNQSGTKAAVVTPVASPFTHKELVVLTQGYLENLGFNPGPADGILGKQTRIAIENFQQQNQMSISGDVSPLLVNRLKAAAG